MKMNQYGEFVHLIDPEDNKIELWERADIVFTKLYEGNYYTLIIKPARANRTLQRSPTNKAGRQTLI